MKVYLTSAVTFDHSLTAIPEFQTLADADKFGVHHVTDDPNTADLILFVDAHQHPDWRLVAIKNHPLVKKWPQKVLLYNERDRPWCTLPGLYVSMPQSTFDPSRQRACAYHRTLNTIAVPSSIVPDLLYSFMGAKSHKVRDRLFCLPHPSGFVEDTSAVNFFDLSDNAETKARVQVQKQRFVEIVARSRFVLCPRGHGTSSIRLYEVLAAGRVPVIISDEWVPPPGPDWENCTLRWPEAAVSRLPAFLETQEPQFPAFASAAKSAYDDWFAPNVLFHRMMESCCQLLELGQKPRASFFDPLNRQYLRYALSDAKSVAMQMIKGVKI